MPGKKTKNSKLNFSRFSRKNLLIFGAVFAVIGSYALYQSFAAQQYTAYYGKLTSDNPSATYTLSTGDGPLDVSFSNNTADVSLTIQNSDGVLIGRLNSRGKNDVSLKTEIFADTYTFSLNSAKAFNSSKGYSIKIQYPEVEATEEPAGDTDAPSIIIQEPFDKESVSGTSTITAEASDNVGVVSVKMYVNEKLVKSDIEEPWYTRWDTRQFAEGAATIKVIATDEAGNSSTATGTVIVDNVADATESANSRFPGDPNPKVNNKAYWGAGIAGNGDPARHEDPTGKSLSVRRTFYQWSHVTSMTSSMYRRVAEDTSNNRLPFISFKTPGWKAMGDGKYDTEIDAMLRKLDSYGKPVWLVAHHEPEGGGTFGNSPDDDGGPAEWRRMQIKIRQRINAVGTTNIAFMPVTMTYTWNPKSGRTPSDWWVDGIWDAYCVDHYAHSEGAKLLDQSWFDFVDFVEKKNIPFCIGEWGNRGTDTAAGNLMREFWNWSFDNDKDMLAYTYFDSDLNSPGGSWELVGDRLKVFQDIMKNDTRVQRIDELE